MEKENEMIISGPEFKDTIPDCSLAEYLLPILKAQPRDEIAQIDSETGATKTNQEILKESLGLANGLLSTGFQTNDIVAFVSRNRHELYVATLAAIWAGGVAAPLDHGMKVYELKHMFGLIQPNYVFCENEVEENVEKALSLTEMHAKIILLDSKEGEYLTFQKLITDVDFEISKPQPIESPSTQISMMIPTSDTGKLTKEVGLTHRNVIYRLITFIGKEQSRKCWLMTTSYFWLSGILQYLALAASGIPRIFIKNITEENILKAIYTFKPPWGFFSPATLNSLMNYPDFKKYDVSVMQSILCGGNPANEFLINRLQKEWSNDVKVQRFYGLTETTGRITEAIPGANINSVGKLLPGVKIKILDALTKNSLGPNQIGEICIKSNGLMKCYVGDEDATNQAIDKNGWLHTGDLGYYDRNEYLYIVDRMEETIKVQDEHVYPQQLENLIGTLPGVAEVGVIGIPNEKDEYHPMAMVVKENETNISEEDIIRVVRENLSDQKHLKGGAKFIDFLPRTQDGKIKRSELKELALASHKN